MENTKSFNHIQRDLRNIMTCSKDLIHCNYNFRVRITPINLRLHIYPYQEVKFYNKKSIHLITKDPAVLTRSPDSLLHFTH